MLPEVLDFLGFNFAKLKVEIVFFFLDSPELCVVSGGLLLWNVSVKRDLLYFILLRMISLLWAINLFLLGDDIIQRCAAAAARKKTSVQSKEVKSAEI